MGTNYDRPTFRPVLSPHGGENPEKHPKMARFGPFWPVFSVQSSKNPVYTSYSGPKSSKRSEIFATGSVPTARNFLSFTPLDGMASSGLHTRFSAQNGPFWAFLAQNVTTHRDRVGGRDPRGHISASLNFSAPPGPGQASPGKKFSPP